MSIEFNTAWLHIFFFLLHITNQSIFNTNRKPAKWKTIQMKGENDRNEWAKFICDWCSHLVFISRNIFYCPISIRIFFYYYCTYIVKWFQNAYNIHLCTRTNLHFLSQIILTVDWSLKKKRFLFYDCVSFYFFLYFS